MAKVRKDITEKLLSQVMTLLNDVDLNDIREITVEVDGSDYLEEEITELHINLSIKDNKIAEEDRPERGPF